MNFLVQASQAWRGPRQRPHHLMERFASAGHSVRWVESRYLRWLLDKRGDFLQARCESPHPGLEVRPVTLVNGERFPPVRAFNQSRLAGSLNAPLVPGPRILWIYNPNEGHLADRVPHDLLIYDIMDEYQGFPWSPPGIADEEAALLARADWIFAGTGALFDAKRPRAEGRIECLLSGVDPEHFAKAAPPPVEIRTLRQRYHKLAGYAGVIDLRVDEALLRQATEALPEWGFVFVGPVVGEASRLATIPNLHLLGSRPYAELPSFYKAWDVALLPFIENTLTRHINPTKMLEYAAAGVPIVARALPDVRRFYSDGSWLYVDADGFIRHLKMIAEAPEATLAPTLEAARGWCRERSWDAIAERMLTRITDLLAERHP